MSPKFFLALALVSQAPAQWLTYPSPGIPRTAGGTPNLTAPAPRLADGKPDLSGMWAITLNAAGYRMNVATDLKPGEVQPWAAALFQQRMEGLGKDDPWTVDCLPLGTRHITSGGAAKFIQSPGLIVILFEDLAYRQIFMDGRKLPSDPNPTWMGYSVGHWEGDTLVIESTGFNDRSWLDMGGHPHTETLKMTERFRRRDFGHLDLQVTFDDPKAYSRPWSVTTSVSLMPDTELLESVCAENERDRQHLVGRTTQEQSVKVAPEVLAKYVGVYESEPESADGRFLRTPRFDVTLTDGQLYIDIGGKGKLPMIALSETTFSPRLLGTYEFIKDARGEVTQVIAHAAEGDYRAVRKRF